MQAAEIRTLLTEVKLANVKVSLHILDARMKENVAIRHVFFQEIQAFKPAVQIKATGEDQNFFVFLAGNSVTSQTHILLLAHQAKAPME